MEQGQDSHRMPTFLPDGKHFVYYAMGTDSARTGLYLGSIEGKQSTRLRDADSFAAYADPGLLVFVQSGRLLAQALDERSLRLTGDAISLAESIIYDVDFTQSSAFAVSRSGNIAFRNAPVRGNELVWFDREGKRLGTLAHAGDYAEPALSHDGRYVAVQRGRDVILISVTTGASSRLVGGSYGPTWSPDDKRIIFSHIERGGSDIFLQEISDAGSPKLLVHSTATKNMDDWSQDGRYIAWGNTDLQSPTGPDLYIMQLDGGHQPIAFLSTPFNEGSARFCPDGKWIAYTSDESGRDEIYVQPFPKGGDKLPISIGGGSEPYWRGDGKEIFYLSADRKLMAVAVRTTGTQLEAGSPTVLFRTIVPSLLDARSHYVPAADGQRFLVVADLPENQSAPVNVVLNFPAELNR
jgi:Tol biopolymer transport system component